MKAWAALLTCLSIINCRRLIKRSLEDAKAPPDGYLPTEDYDYGDDLAGYNSNQDDPAHSSSEDELPGSISLPESKENSPTEEQQDEDIESKNMDGESNDELNAENSIEIEDDELIRYNGGPIDLIEDNVDLRIEFDLPMFDIENDNNETTTKEPDNDGTANNIDYNVDNDDVEARDNLDTGYGSPSEEDKNNIDILEEDDEAIITENAEKQDEMPQNEFTNGENTEAESDDNADSPKERTTSEDNGDADEEQNINEEAPQNETYPSPLIKSDSAIDNGNTPDDKLSGLSSFSSLSASIKICPGDSMTVCVSVCPGTTARIYGACVQGCAERCEHQEPR